MSTPRSHPTDLLPWWVNGTLQPAERARVETHLKQCEQCREEVAFLEKIRTGLRAAPQPDAGELSLKRLMREVRKGQSARRPRFGGWAIAAALVIALQGGLLLTQWRDTADEASYQALSTETSSQTVLQVQFAPTATVAQIQALLDGLNARIIDGPSAIGLYRVALPADADIQAALQTLRSARQVVVHAARD